MPANHLASKLQKKLMQKMTQLKPLAENYLWPNCSKSSSTRIDIALKIANYLNSVKKKRMEKMKSLKT